MIINNTFRFIFVHVPKAAGTSLTAFLSRYSCYCDLEVGGTALGEAIQPLFRSRFGLSKHSNAREIKAVVGEVLWKKYFSFAFVRNPYERAFSSYWFLRKMRAEKQLAALAPMDRLETFAEFVLSDYFKSDGLDRILMPQFFWVRRDNRTDQLAVDYVGRVENINHCLEEIGQTIQRDIRKPALEGSVPILNRSSESSKTVWTELADTPAIEELIFRKYEMDFRNFDYARSVNQDQARAHQA